MPTLRKPVELEVPKRCDGRSARIRPLATLPVFLSLENRRVLLAGGTEAAAWKAELVAAAGAEVHVYSEAFDPAMEKLLTAGSIRGCFVRHDRLWSEGSFEGAALAIADATTNDEAVAFRDAARAAGVPVNVVDKPSFCDFQFGSIVNRSPIVIGISTNGAAPILGQAIRQRIETLLPLTLADWAGLAGQLRKLVLKTLQPGAQRRRFWEKFTEIAFSERDAPDACGDFGSLVAAIGKAQPVDRGQVTLVGAGPGRAEHLTLKAVRALQGADVILFDELVAEEVLELARREARRVRVGKRGGQDICREENIFAMMMDLTSRGQNVVRLKSGDPMVLGRDGGEIERLRCADISVSIIPGVPAVYAVAS